MILIYKSSEKILLKIQNKEHKTGAVLNLFGGVDRRKRSYSLELYHLT